MKILVTGATGFVGQALCQYLITKGNQVVIISRNKENAIKAVPNSYTQMTWEELNSIEEKNAIEIDYVVNLAGESIGSGRWAKKKKEKIINSRINATRSIVDGIEKDILRPKALINASAVGYYGDRGDEILTESSTSGRDFLAEVSKSWEKEANRALQYGVRVVTLRIGAVLGHGGALEKMVLPFTFYAGGPLGSGNQWFSWIHLTDLVRLIHFVMESDKIEGPMNATTPHPERNKDFSRAFGKVMNRPSWLPVPSLILQLALGEMSDLLLKGQRVLPKKAEEEGFEFLYPTVESALQDIMNR